MPPSARCGRRLKKGLSLRRLYAPSGSCRVTPPTVNQQTEWDRHQPGRHKANTSVLCAPLSNLGRPSHRINGDSAQRTPSSEARRHTSAFSHFSEGDFRHMARLAIHPGKQLAGARTASARAGQKLEERCCRARSELLISGSSVESLNPTCRPRVSISPAGCQTAHRRTVIIVAESASYASGRRLATR